MIYVCIRQYMKKPIRTLMQSEKGEHDNTG